MSSTLRGFIFGLLFTFVLPLVFFGMTGCSTAEVDENDPVALMKDAEADVEGSRYILALEKFQRIKNQHPYSSQATEAQLRIADVYFLQDSFAEAAATYEAFKDLHPKHPKLGYAAYRVGLAFFNDLPSLEARDLSSGFRAQDAFVEYLHAFPNDEFNSDAKTKLAETRKILAGKELYIANFYYKRKMWEAAKGRFNNVVNQYSDTSYVDEAKQKLKKIDTFPPEKVETTE